MLEDEDEEKQQQESIARLVDDPVVTEQLDEPRVVRNAAKHVAQRQMRVRLRVEENACAR